MQWCLWICQRPMRWTGKGHDAIRQWPPSTAARELSPLRYGDDTAGMTIAPQLLASAGTPMREAAPPN